MPGVLLVVCFLVGVGIFLYRNKLEFSFLAAAVSLPLAFAAITFLPYGDYVAPWAIAYLTVYIGLLNPHRTFFVIGADYSYGLFLYGYPIQQALATYEGWPRIWYANIAATVVLGIICASLSWHVVERPALGLRHPFRLLEEKWLNRKLSGQAGLPTGSSA
jgi:peptidoglycan/LPS O-acetylase OafA/YrhL